MFSILVRLAGLSTGLLTTMPVDAMINSIPQPDTHDARALAGTKQRAQLRWLVVNCFFNIVAINVDQLALGDGFSFALAIRLLLVAPVLLIGMALHIWSPNLALRSFATGVGTVLFIGTVAGLAQFANDAFSSRYLMIATFMLFTAILFAGLPWQATKTIAFIAWALFSGLAVINVNLQVAYMNVDLIFLCGSTAGLALVLRRRQDLQMTQILAMGETDARRVSELNEANAKLARLSQTDPLTGLANRRQLDEFMGQSSSSLVPCTAYGVLMIDIDHFKRLNDYSGHAEGDRCLRLVAETIARNTRCSEDLLARYGGEEFAMILRDAEKSEVFSTAERVRLAVQNLGFPNPGAGIGEVVTVSIGAYVAVDSEPVAEALQKADGRLYNAKANGRNRVAIGDGADVSVVLAAK